MLMDSWVQANLGKGIDYDGVYGVQCVDLAKHFIKNVLEVTPQSIGNAIEYYNKRNTSVYLKKHFKWIDNTAKFIPAKGDLCVFESKSGRGHISVATGEGTTSYFYSYDQNFPSAKHEPMTKIKHSYHSFLGVLRPYNQSNIKSVGRWLKNDKGWFYLKADGTRARSQWIKDSVDWCYLDNEGYMKTNAWQQDSQGWCFVTNDGHLLRNGYAWDGMGKHWLDKTGHIK